MKNSILLSLFSILINIVFTNNFLNAQSDFWIPLNTPLVKYSRSVRCADGQVVINTDSGLYRSTDAGINWNHLIVGSGNSNVGTFAIDSTGAIIAWTVDSLIYRESDNENWINIGNTPCPIEQMEIDSEGRIFVQQSSTRFIHRSIDSGKTFTRVYEMGDLYSKIVDWIITPKGYLLIANTGRYSNYGYLTRSTDHGDSWTTLGLSVAPNIILTLSASPMGDLFAGTSAEAGNGITGLVERSTNDGDIWFPLNYNWLNSSVYCIAVNSIGDIFVGTSNGLYLSTDSGTIWNEINSGLPSTRISTLSIDKNDYVYCTLEPSSVLYRSSTPTTKVEDKLLWKSLKFELNQNYPNPFNPMTKIVFTIPHDNHVKIIVYDVLGRELLTLVNEFLTAGSYETTFNASSLSSGIYFYQLTAGMFMDVKKMVLSR